MPSPIVLFVYARPEHTLKTLTALSLNSLAGQSELIVYSDAAKNDRDLHAVNRVRQLIRSAKGFRAVSLIERNENFGLARNIIGGVTEVCKAHGRAIILEDDLVTSPYFLSYMNEALELYADQKRVMHISGYSFPTSRFPMPGDTFSCGFRPAGAGPPGSVPGSFSRRAMPWWRNSTNPPSMHSISTEPIFTGISSP